MSYPNTPTVDPINWVDDDDLDKVVEPSGPKQTQGFQAGESFPARYMNYFLYSLSKWHLYFKGTTDQLKIDVTFREFTTGDGKLTLKAAADAGWVMMNDGTIGSAASGATTRANADTEALYTLLWNNVSDTYAAVTGGRGANAAADFAANKPIALTKQLGRAIIIAGAGSGLTSRALGLTVGSETHQLISSEMPSHTHTQNSHNHTQDAHGHSVSDPGHNHGQNSHTHTVGGSGGGGGSGAINIGPTSVSTGATTATNTGNTTGLTVVNNTATNQSATATNQNTGGDGAHNNMQPSAAWNVMIRL